MSILFIVILIKSIIKNILVKQNSQFLEDGVKMVVNI
nr:MAG TPA: hypothetical protein [Caudoviricetes sp.]